MGAFIGSVIAGIAGNLGSDFIGGLFPQHREPTALEILVEGILSLLPQIIVLVLIVCTVLLYIGIFKNYKVKIATLLYPIGLAIVYLISLTIATFFNSFIVIAWALAIFFTVVYFKISYSVYKGTKKFKDTKSVLKKMGTVLEKDVNVGTSNAEKDSEDK